MHDQDEVPIQPNVPTKPNVDMAAKKDGCAASFVEHPAEPVSGHVSSCVASGITGQSVVSYVLVIHFRFWLQFVVTQ